MYVIIDFVILSSISLWCLFKFVGEKFIITLPYWDSIELI